MGAYGGARKLACSNCVTTSASLPPEAHLAGRHSHSSRPALLQVFWEKQLDTKCCVGWNEDTVRPLLLLCKPDLPAALHCSTCDAPALQQTASVPLP